MKEVLQISRDGSAADIVDDICYIAKNYLKLLLSNHYSINVDRHGDRYDVTVVKKDGGKDDI